VTSLSIEVGVMWLSLHRCKFLSTTFFQRCTLSNVTTIRPSTRPRLSEVAALAGVSEKTVSNVINNYPHVTERTRSKVESALTELNYRPNLSARSLASGRTGFIALAVPGLDNPYFAELAGHVIQAAAAQNWTVLIEQTGGSTATESQVVGGVMPYLVDGIVLHPEALSAAELTARMDSTPIVLIGEKSLDHVVDHVAADNVAAAHDLTSHLLSTGRRRIAVVGIERDTEFTTSALRFEGYSSALANAGIALDPDLAVVVDNFKRADGVDAVNQLMALPNPPDAIICFNDVIAVGALSRLNAMGIDVPGAIAVAGFDNLDETLYTAPPLTTIAWDTRRIAEEAIALLAARQGGEQRPQQEVSVGYDLVVRGSTATAARP